MERLTQSAVGPAGDVHLRFGYVPPSLQRLHGEQRGQRAGHVLRLAMLACVVVVTAAGVYRDARTLQPTPTLPSLVSGGSATLATGLEADRAPVVLPMTASAPTPDAAASQGTPLDGGAVAPMSSSLASDILLSPRARALAAAQSRLPVATPVPIAPLDTASLRRALVALTAGGEGQYAISVIDLTTSQEIDIDASQPMNAASVNKLEILAALYHECAVGRLHLDQTLTTSEANMQDYGTGVIRYQPLGTRYTLAQLAQLLIEQSDNTASYMLAQAIGLDTIDALVASWGLHSTIVGQEVSSAQDAARFMQLLYQGKLANAADTSQMLGYLTHTAFNDRLPAGLPGNIEVAHKIGTEVKVENDVAIVLLPGRPYVLSVFAGDATEEQAVPVEQAISRTVYQFEQQAKGGS